jgi:hypothetical protein
VFVYSRIDDGLHPSVVCDEHILTIHDHHGVSAVAPESAAVVPEPAAAAPEQAPEYMGGFYAEIAAMRAERMARYAAITDSLKASSALSRNNLISELDKMKAEREARYAKLLGDINGGIQSESITSKLNLLNITNAIEDKKEERTHYTIMAALDAEEAALLEKINKS